MKQPLTPYSAAIWCRLSYQGPKMPGVIRFRANNLAADIIEADRGIRVCIVRGSDDMADWRQNVTLWPGKLAFGDSGRLYCHGFIEDARAVYGFALGRVDMFTGHSRGAIVAAIVAASLGIPATVFAQPRGMWLGPELTGAKHVRVINHAGDWVTHNPCRWLGFRHVGRVETHPGSLHGVNAYLATAKGLVR